MNDPFDLQRFVDAQNDVNDAFPGFEQVCAQLREGCKTGHWMWFIFPQIKGLGRSKIAMKYAISSREEAIAYLEHPILGPRLRKCSQLVVEVEGRSVQQILGVVDDLKFRSSMTLFAHVTADNKVFKDALVKYYGGEFDRLTLERL